MLSAAECLAIIRSAYPGLPVRSYTFNDRGQNNDVLIVNGEIVFRFPRTRQAANQLRVEAAILRYLQGRVTLRIPNPTYLRLEADPWISPRPSQPGAPEESVRPGSRDEPVRARSRNESTRVGPGSRPSAPRSPIIGRPPIAGRATAARRNAGLSAAARGQPAGPGRPAARPKFSGRLPWAREREERGTREKEERERERHHRQGPRGVFIGYRWIPGEQLWRETMLATEDERIVQAWADQLAGFLRELHSTPIQGELSHLLLPYDRRARWEDFFRRVRDKLFSHMRPDARDDVARRFETFLQDPANFARPMTLVHGDFGPSNILLDPVARRVTGVIDFGNSGLDDPAVDLAALIGPFGFGEAFLRRFDRNYPIEAADLERARFYAGTFRLQDAVFGLETGDAEAFNWGIAPYR